MVGTSGAQLPEGIGPAARRLAQELRALKNARGLTLTQLGAQTHYSRASWERWLNGKRLITPDALASLGARYSVDVTALLALLELARSADGFSEGSDDALADIEALGLDDAALLAGPSAQSPSPTAGSRAAAAEDFAATARIAQLPPTTSDFTGRREQIASLRAALTPGSGDPGQLPIAAVTGGGGLGKTTLAVHVAHLVAANFPDGQLYVDLLGACEPQARTPEDVLEEWLRVLGQDPATLPSRLEERAALFRSLLSRSRMLLLLDNARDIEQIRPLLPAANTCAVLITSRNRMAELPGAYKLGLESLPDDEAWTLLAQLAGASRLAAEPEATTDLLRACGGIPLALRIAGARLAARANWRVSTLANRLRDERRRLDELEIGDLAARASFQVSYAALAKTESDAVPSAARAFRLLGLATGPDISLPAAAALLGVSARRAERVLESLVDGHLLESPTPDRYRMHDLVRLYAAEQVRRDEDEPVRQAAVARLTGWYLATAANANAWLAPQARPVPVDAITLSCRPIEFTLHEQALAWCDAERANLSAAVQSAADHGCRENTWKLAAALLGFYNLRRHLADWTATHQTGLSAAEAAGDRVGEAWMHNNLGFVYFYWEESDRKALNCFERSLEIRIELEDLTGQAIALNNMGGAYHRLGDPEEGMRCLERATRIREELGDRLGVGMSCLNIGCIYVGSHRPALAEPYLHRALAIVEELGNRQLTVTTLNNLGEVYIQLQDQQAAMRYLKRSLGLSRELGDVPGQALALQSLAKAHYDAGAVDVALPLWQQSLELYESVSDPVADEVRAELAEAGSAGGAR